MVSIRTAASLIIEEPNYSRLAGRLLSTFIDKEVKNQDINSVVADVAKADMSFKLLVGVRNKLVTAYKETMKMQV